VFDRILARWYKAWSFVSLGILTGILALLLVACEQEDDPTQIMRSFMDAIERFDVDAAENLVCPGQRAKVRESLASLEGIAKPSEAFDVRITDLKVEELDNDGETALLHVKGQLTLVFLGQQEVQQIDEKHTLIRENGQWLICDL
jgi:hypothetical protein